MKDYKVIIDKLNLIQHPEGGYYRRTWQSLLKSDIIDNSGKLIFPMRSIGSSILYLLPSNEVATWHRINCDEMWHYYSGSPIRVYVISNLRGMESFILGPSFSEGELFQLVIPRLTWFAAEVVEMDSYTICGCTLYPSFTYADFEIAERSKLLDEHPKHADLINHIYRK
ncbi:MAG: cupin domain-containing protein [Candidatus Cloacimonetes bacterium]|nr:cupin domain-containing protein [Candidatus Cloacimonadota bacterium]